MVSDRSDKTPKRPVSDTRATVYQYDGESKYLIQISTRRYVQFETSRPNLDSYVSAVDSTNYVDDMSPSV